MPKHRVLIIGDGHAPALHPKYPDFLQSIYDYWGCNRVLVIGDIVDWAAISFHQKQTFLPNAEEELELARIQIKELTQRFDKADYLLGNHCCLPQRQMATLGLPEKLLRTQHDILGLPRKWKVHPRYHKLNIDNVLYLHGDQGKRSTSNAAFANACAFFMPTVQGHYHSQGGVVYGVNDYSRYFGLQVGCGVVPDSPYMHYSKEYIQRPVLGCGVVLEGREAHFLPMYLEKWERD